MKKIWPFFLLILWMSSCKTSDEKVPNTDLDVARAFIQSSLSNHFDQASQYVLKNDQNIQYIDLCKRKFSSFSKTEQEHYKDADIIMNDISYVVKDSVTIINYSNTYKKESKNVLKLVKTGGKWQVDLQYTFSGNL